MKMKDETRTSAPKGRPRKDGGRRSATREKQSRIESEHALAVATAPVPAILGGAIGSSGDEGAGDSIEMTASSENPEAGHDVATGVADDMNTGVMNTPPVETVPVEATPLEP